MKADKDSVDRLLASVADGIPVDWDAEARAGGPAARSRLEALRAISNIAEFSRSVQRTGEDAPFPERWGGLLLLERLGGGSQADVFRAWDPSLRREVALKLLRPDALVLAARDDDAVLLAEGRAAAAIRHPHVVTVYGIERHDGRVGLSMELLRGTTLEQDVLARGPLEPGAAARLGTEIGSALAAVHAGGLVHRDLKPANVVRDAEGRFVLADFGLGLRAGAAAGGASGTPMYMSPETLAGAPATARSDVYSLGLLLWFALAGRHPFEVRSLAERIAVAAAGPSPALRELRPQVPPRLAAVIERAIAPEPSARHASARELAAALAGADAPGQHGERRSWPLLALAAGVIAVAALFFVARGPRTAAPPAVPPAAPAAAVYDVEASFLRHAEAGPVRLSGGDRVRPGDRLSLELRATRPVWVYVLNEDERGEQYLLFPQPSFDRANPLPADSAFTLPGSIGGRPSAWTVTSAGGREHFLVVASPEPVAELEADLARLPAPRPGAPVTYATVGPAAGERLRGVGGVTEVPGDAVPASPRQPAFARFRGLAARETGVTGVWVRHVTLENPR